MKRRLGLVLALGVNRIMYSQDIRIAAALSILIGTIVSSPSSAFVLQTLAILAWSFVGVGHGVLDLGAGPKSKLQSKSKSLKMLLFYLVAGALTYLSYRAFPAATLAVFVLMSAGHFGSTWFRASSAAERLSEQEFSSREKLWAFIWGASLLGIAISSADAFTLQASSVQPEIASLIVSQREKLILLFLAAGFSCASVKQSAHDAAAIATIAVLFLTTNFFTAFSTFFILWHAWPAFLLEWPNSDRFSRGIWLFGSSSLALTSGLFVFGAFAPEPTLARTVNPITVLLVTTIPHILVHQVIMKGDQLLRGLRFFLGTESQTVDRIAQPTRRISE